MSKIRPVVNIKLREFDTIIAQMWIFNHCVTLDYKTSHKGQFRNWDLCKFWKLNQKDCHWSMFCDERTIFGQDITIFKAAICWSKKTKYWENCPNEVLSYTYYLSKILFWYIYGRKFTKYINGTWSLLNVRMFSWHKIQINHFDPYNVFLAIATNIPQRLKTGFVLQGHLYVANVFLHKQVPQLPQGYLCSFVSNTK